MPHLGLSGLSENWLLRECGDRHWQAVCETVGVPSHQLCNRTGHRLYSSFIATEISGDPLGAFGENDTLSFAIRVTRLSPYRFFSSQHVVCASEGLECTVNMVTLFVKKETFEDNYSLSREAVAISRAPEFCITEPADAFAAERLQLAHRLLKDAPPACLPSEYVYDICPLTDFNAARFLYFAGYQTILDRAEWHLLRRPGLEFGSTVHRRMYYFANINIGDRAIVRIGGFEQDGANYRFDAVLTRGSDGRMIACAESVRTLRMFGEAAEQAGKGPDGWAGRGLARGQPAQLNGNAGNHEDMPHGLVGRSGCQQRFINLAEP
jgi:probable biosynthetic protein (TIGR04098 family)